MSSKTKLMVVATLCAAVLIGGYTLLSHDSANGLQRTDDAYVAADYSTVSTRIAGILNSVLIEDNQLVKQGELLATLDDQDQRAALHAAEAQLHSAKAGAEALKQRLAQQKEVIAQADAAVEADKALLDLARSNAERYRNLAKDGSGSVQQEQAAETELRVRGAALHKDLAALAAAQQQEVVLQAELQQAQSDIETAQAALEVAQLQLSYTRILSPINGVIGQRRLRIGQYVHVGEPLLSVVPLHNVYIEANFRETQLAHMAKGQKARISVDALPGVALEGTVDSVSPATGLTFSPIAPSNATGNFTKVVQRLPVKITLDPGQGDTAKLKVGMSVVPTVYISH